MAKVNERLIALKILEDTISKELFVNQVIDDYFFVYNYDKQQRGFISRLLYGSIENQIYIDFVINIFSKIKVERMKPVIQHVMRLSVYQLLFMTKVPSSATINEAVKIVKARKLYQLVGFVNGVLRTIDRDRDTIDEELNKLSSKSYISTKYSVNEQIIGYLQKDYSDEELISYLKASNNKKDTCVRINTIKAPIKKVTLILDKHYDIKDSNLFDDYLYVSGYDTVGKMEGFREGYFVVQDESSGLVGMSLTSEELENEPYILDVCSAPGGKAIHIAQRMNNKGSIIACDISDHKLSRIQENATRLGVTSIKTRNLDGTTFTKEFENKFDVVLADVPCSGLGVIRSKPDIKLNMTVAKMKELIVIQANILSNVKSYVKPGGILLYSTCTINKKENELQINKFLEENEDFELVDLTQVFQSNKKVQDHIDQKMLKVFTDKTGTDGFFIAKLKRKDVK